MATRNGSIPRPRRDQGSIWSCNISAAAASRPFTASSNSTNVSTRPRSIVDPLNKSPASESHYSEDEFIILEDLILDGLPLDSLDLPRRGQRISFKRAAGLKSSTTASVNSKKSEVLQYPAPASAKELRLSIDSGLDISSAPLKIIVDNAAVARELFAHESLLGRHSEFFAAATRNEWKESRERAVRLPKDDPTCFEVFARFLYGGRLHTKGNEADSYTSKFSEWEFLQKCWLMGDRLISPSFKDYVMDALIQKCQEKRQSDFSLYRLAYSGTSDSNSLRRLAVDLANEFFRDVAVELAKIPSKDRRPTNAPFAQTDCHYHEHRAADKPCYKTMFE